MDFVTSARSAEEPGSTPPLPSRLSFQHKGPAKGPGYEMWREGICRSFCQLDVAPVDDEYIDCRTEIASLHSVSMATPKGTSARFARTRDLLKDGCDDFVLISASSGVVCVTQGAKTIDLQAGQMCLTEMNVVGAAHLNETGAFTTTRFPRAFLLRASPSVESQLARPLAQEGAVRSVFDRYFAICNEFAAGLDVEGQKLAAQHLADLVALLSASDTDAKDAALRGYSAARLEVLKSYIVKTLGDGDVSIETVSRANGLSERQTQRLFARAGTTFSQYVLEQRLDLARRVLLRAGERKISDVAYSVGFSDLSHFNRSFRKRFGVTPSDLRAAPDDRL